MSEAAASRPAYQHATGRLHRRRRDGRRRIFSLLGAAGEVAGAAVWLSFLLAGGIAALQGYSFAKLGSRYPSAGGLLEYVNRGFGDGHIATIVAWLVYIANGIVTAMVAISFGSYASSAVAGGNPAAVKAFAVALLIAMTGLNVAGRASSPASRASWSSCHRHPGRVRDRHDRATWSPATSPRRPTRASATSCRASP